MRSLVYYPAAAGAEPINLSGTEFDVGQALGLRAAEPSYTLTRFTVSGQASRAREASLTVKARSPELFDRVLKVFDADWYAKTPGRLVIDGEWFQRVFIPKHGTSAASEAVDNPSAQTWTVILLDGMWLKYDKVMSFSPRLSVGDGLDMGFDLAAPAGSVVKALSLRVAGLPSGPFGDQRTFQLLALFSPVDATGQQVEWGVDNADVASVSASGLLTLTGEPGSVTLICTQAGGGVTASTTLTVSYDAQGEGTARQGLVFPDGGYQDYAMPDASDPTLLDLTLDQTQGFFYTGKHPLTGGHQYKVSYRIRLVSGSPTQGNFGLVLWGDGIYAGKDVHPKDLTAQWQTVEYTATIPEGKGTDAYIVLNEYEQTLPEHVRAQIGGLRITDLTAIGRGGE